MSPLEGMAAGPWQRDRRAMNSQLNQYVAAAISADRLREARRCQTSAGAERPRRSPAVVLRKLAVAMGVVR